MRDVAFDVMRDHGLTTVFANPGSTEVPFLGGLPEDMRFVLGLHEGSVVGMATGWAIARREAAFVLVHTAAGLGNAVAALATADLPPKIFPGPTPGHGGTYPAGGGFLWKRQLSSV